MRDWIEAGLNLFGIGKQDKAAQEQVRLQNEATEAQYKYNVATWEMAAKSIAANHAYSVQEIETKARNEGRLAAHKDAANLRTYNYNLQIRDRQQDLNDRMYAKSEDIFDNQIGINKSGYIFIFT